MSYDWLGKKPWAIQRTTTSLLARSARAYVLNEFGCVDADTEYLSPDGWHRIADYVEGTVAEYRPDSGTIAFVEPTGFHKIPCPEMIRFRTRRGVDQLLSPEHGVLYVGSDGTQRVESAEAIYARYNKPKAIRFITTFRLPDGETAGLPLTDAEIRLQVAVNADGHQQPYKNGKVSVRLKKLRKRLRIVRLLDAAGIAHVENKSGEGFTAYRFVPPERKHEYQHWWVATQHQLEVVADEAAHWDGSHRKADGLAFSSLFKGAADFIQYAFSATGRRTSLGFSDRIRNGVTLLEWRVHASSRTPLAQLTSKARGEHHANTWIEPSTDGFKYCFTVPSSFLLLRRNGCIFATKNTGKTRSVIWAADYLKKNKGIGPVLVAAPLSTLVPVWETELFRLDVKARVQILHGTKQERLDRLAAPADWYIINHHGLDLLHEELALKGFSVFVIDELAVLRNARTNCWRAARRIIDSGKIPYVWGLTGSPTPKAPTDAWAQIKLLTPQNTTRSFTRFRDLTMNQITQFRWVKKPTAVTLIHQQMQPAVRYRLDDVTELPDTTYRRFDVPLEPLAAKAYKMMLDKLRMQTNNGETITAANEGILQSKLLQVACGFIYTDDKGVVRLPVQPRLDKLLEIIEWTERKFIVFVPFVHALEGVAQHLIKAGEDIAVVHGGTPVGLRNKVFSTYVSGPSPRGIVAHPGCMAHGLTLTSANTIIWYSPTNSFETYEQANARIVRPGQTSKTLIAHLVGTSVERAVYARLQDRKSFQGLLLDLFHQQH